MMYTLQGKNVFQTKVAETSKQITDHSDFRQGCPTAHRIFGPSETANRAYLCLTKVMNKTSREQPHLVGFLLHDLEDILHGQDISLVWRREGIQSLPKHHEDRMRAYRRSASLKTGALFRLVGHLVFEDESHDDLMTRVGFVAALHTVAWP